jgi:hypothetical protein
MRRAANRFDVDKLFVFGAGASSCATGHQRTEKRAPLDKDFCQRILDLEVTRPQWVQELRHGT